MKLENIISKRISPLEKLFLGWRCG